MSEAGPDAAGGVADALQNFGRYLHRERELRGLTREDVARSTKLAPAVIGALESGDPARMPPRAYLFGYLRNYSSAVGLDADDVVLRYQEAVDPGKAPPEPPEDERRFLSLTRRRWVLVALAFFAALALGLGLWRGPRGPGEIRGRRSPERAPYHAPLSP